MVNNFSQESEPYKPIIIEDIEDEEICIPSDVNINNKFQSFVFFRCKRTRIIVKSKILRVLLVDCEKCCIIVFSPMIGAVELLRCSSSSVDIRKELPFVHSELCKDINVYQRIPSVFYNIIDCLGCKNIITQDTGRVLRDVPSRWGRYAYILKV
jgi:hypothetical protein